jgi:uncharacterized protein YjbI with pentapeptide repeats
MKYNGFGTLAEALTAHRAWLNDEKDAKRLDLSGADLSNTNLSNADLSNANLTDANLSGAMKWEQYLAESQTTLMVRPKHRRKLERAQ